MQKNAKDNTGDNLLSTRLRTVRDLTVYGLYMSGFDPQEIALIFNVKRQNVEYIINKEKKRIHDTRAH